MSDITPAETTASDTEPQDAVQSDSAFSNATPSETTAAESAFVQTAPRPRIRWGAIVWGLIVCAIAAATLQVTRTTESREGFALWLTRLTPDGIWLIVVLVTGGVLLLLGLLAAVRRAQRAR